MGLTQFHLVFLVFLKTDLLLATPVAPPTNVTLHCHNLQNFLKWDYDQITPELKFKVTIGSESGQYKCSKELWVNQTSLQVDVSFLSDPDDSFYLDVRAVVKFNESEPSPPDGITFSYFHGTLANQKCSVDLPSVNVAAHPDDHVMFRFEHPWLLYHNKLSKCKNGRKKKSNLEQPPLFKYHVKIIGQEHSHYFECEKQVCEEKLLVDAAHEKHCLQISGELLKMLVVPKQEYCAQSIKESHNDHTTIYVVVGVVCLVAAAFVVFMFYRKMTSSSLPLPNSIKTLASIETQLTIPKSPELANIDTPDSPTPLLTNIEGTDVQQEPFIHMADGSTENNVRMPLGISPNNNVSENLKEGSSNGERSAYMEGNNFEDEEEAENSLSPYERRPVLVQLAPDDRTEGYRG